MVDEAANDRLSKIVDKHEAFLRRYPVGEIADLRNQDLRGVEPPGVDLRQALVAGTHLQNAVFARANISDAQMLTVRLSYVDLSACKLVGVNHRGASLANCKLMAADLTDADMWPMKLNNIYHSIEQVTDLQNSDLSDSKIRLHHGSKFGAKRWFLRRW